MSPLEKVRPATLEDVGKGWKNRGIPPRREAEDFYRRQIHNQIIEAIDSSETDIAVLEFSGPRARWEAEREAGNIRDFARDYTDTELSVTTKKAKEGKLLVKKRDQ